MRLKNKASVNRFPVDYNRIAGIYDSLKRLYPGNSINLMSAKSLQSLPKYSTLLIVGGGTGNMLPQILSEDLEVRIDFVESSHKMIKKAEARILQEEHLKRVNFICIPFQEFEPEYKYDVVFCPFFLDQFEKEELINIISKIRNIVGKNGKLVVCDFNENLKSSLLNKVAIKCLYLFFRLTTHIKAKNLPPISTLIEEIGFVQETSKWSKHKWIYSKVYSTNG